MLTDCPFIKATKFPSLATDGRPLFLQSSPTSSGRTAMAVFAGWAKSSGLGSLRCRRTDMVVGVVCSNKNVHGQVSRRIALVELGFPHSSLYSGNWVVKKHLLWYRQELVTTSCNYLVSHVLLNFAVLSATEKLQ